MAIGFTNRQMTIMFEHLRHIDDESRRRHFVEAVGAQLVRIHNPTSRDLERICQLAAKRYSPRREHAA